MKRLPIRFFLLCLPLLALPGAGQATSQIPACTVVQAAGLSLAERHAAAKASAEAALDPAQHCADGAVRVMADPDSDGRPLQLHDRSNDANSKPAQSSGRADSRCAGRDGCTTDELPPLPVAALAHYAHAAAMVSTATFAGPFSGFPAAP
ncbi:hypothetical protein LMG23992_01752 [Cupriavidus laharis]|uniref:Uncharacterized protein n=1 Tax=Cupriavidus laharis TaxID=151654 RepID=A0ABM8WTB4_9BURK|nr:hypothetical protein [Cupriavidus laharis]CAG9170710.1 hypothetical protein LMG23992_01752 [Cupriavidus laharis]